MVLPEDEINLLELWQVLVRQWQWIAGLTVLAVAAAVAYLLVTPPLYKAEAVLLPPEARHVQAINIPGVNDISLDEGRSAIYRDFISNLRSKSLRRRFFAENNLFPILGGEKPGSEESVFRARFDDAWQVREGTKTESAFLFVTFQGEDPALIAGWVNDFIRLAGNTAISENIEGIRTKIINQKKTLQEQVRIDREFAKQLRLDRIAVLDEQIAIARKLNIIGRDDAPLRALEGNTLGVAVSTAGEPLYMRGVKDLSAEKEALEKRKDDDPFIAGLREKMVTIDRLDSGLRMLATAVPDISAARLDQMAMPPKGPVKPKKKLVLALSLVLGGMLGVFAAFFREFLAKARRPEH